MRRGDADPPQLLMLSTAFTAQTHLWECETPTPELLLCFPLTPPVALGISPVQAVKLWDIPVPEPRAWMLEEKRAPGTACSPSRAWGSRDPWAGMSPCCSPHPSLMSPAQFLAQEVGTRSKKTGGVCRAFFLPPLKDIFGRPFGLSEPKPVMIWLGKSSWLLQQPSFSCWKPSRHREVPGASQHFTLLALLLIFLRLLLGPCLAR